MANVSYLRESGNRRASRRGRGGLPSAYRGAPRRHRSGPRIVLGLALVVVAAVVAAGVVLGTSHAALTTDAHGIAKVDLPLGGGTIQTVSVVTGPHSTAVPVTLSGGTLILPTKAVRAGSRLSVQVVVKRPGWIGWLNGATTRLSLAVTAPAARLRSDYVTVSGRRPLQLHFATPITAYAYGASAHRLRRHVLSRPTSTLTVPRHGAAGTMFVAATPQAWERAAPAAVSWFPATGAATAVANPAPGSRISTSQPITLTFSKTVSSVVGSHLPPVAPATPGTWHTLNSHTIQFRPEGYGYGLGATVKVALPSGVHLVGGQQSGQAAGGTWSVPVGSTVRLQQILATLGYLPVVFHPSGSGQVALTPQAQEAAAVSPPHGTFSMRYPNTPGWLVSDWRSGTGTYGELTKAAVMTFENHVGLASDGTAGPEVWKALINAVIHNQTNSFGYSVADVSMQSPESLSLWHNGHTIMTTAVNTGISQSPTAAGTFAVYEHLPVTTMSGTNPDGSHYHDTGIPWVSYFNGGDALHGFLRGSYGTPQSLGCVEMPFTIAGKVYPYTPIGTIVHVT